MNICLLPGGKLVRKFTVHLLLFNHLVREFSSFCMTCTLHLLSQLNLVSVTIFHGSSVRMRCIPLTERCSRIHRHSLGDSSGTLSCSIRTTDIDGSASVIRSFPFLCLFSSQFLDIFAYRKLDVIQIFTISV